ncbi:energy transducer TonB [Lewinella sp. IMCC34191]|uniref:energy transducer TonB n=1 Tax=Lewinella sp. IMCC34191 TaxID=2259172 RepID=UPI000E23A8C3|nr:energy transducer TonB [Lewinella sp. IMCC34191]
MQQFGLNSRYFSLGFILSVVLTLLAWGFSTAPEVARQRLLPPSETTEYWSSAVELPLVTVTDSGTRIVPPLYPACSNVPEFVKRRQCADQSMLKFIYDNIRYPKEGLDEGAGGTVVVRFPIDARGQTGLPVIVRSPHPALSDASLKVVERMLRRNPIWEPARENDKPVASEFNLPIRFKLDK